MSAGRRAPAPRLRPPTGPGDARAARAWIGQTVRELVAAAPENVLRDRGELRIFGPPLVGVADGDDPLFLRFREVVSPGHLLPRELLRRRRPGAEPRPSRVVVWVLPYTEPIRRSNRGERWPSSLYSQARNNAGALCERLCRRFTEVLEGLGRVAVAPLATEGYDAVRDRDRVFTSTWSERHVAYAAGLGRFGLNGGLITASGIAVRIGSVVTDLPLEPTPRHPGGHRHACLDRGGGCGRCIPRCPVGAISAAGLDKERCYARRNEVRERFLPRYRETLELLPASIVKGGKRSSGHSLGCALCQFGVPCEAAAPVPEEPRGRAHA